MMTNWGYEIEDGADLLITPESFRVLTGNVLSSSDATIEATLRAVTATIRDYCGWHVGPECSCKWTARMAGRTLQLPAMGVVSIDSLKVNGEDYADYVPGHDGTLLMRHELDLWRDIVEVEFVAGYDTAAIGAIVSQVAVNALVAPAGVAHEQAGDVSISYNSTASGVSGGIRLLGSDKAALAAYRIPR